jgi:hypothetical protein
VPRNDAGEADTALAFLRFARHCVLKKTEGLTDEQLRRVMVSSGRSLLGLVQHLVDAERYWFGFHVAGRGVDDLLQHGRAGRPTGGRCPASFHLTTVLGQSRTVSPCDYRMTDSPPADTDTGTNPQAE